MALTAATARTRLEGMLQWQSVPALTSAEVDTLFDLSKRRDSYGTEPDDYLDWKAATAYAVGALRVPTTRNGFVYKVQSVSGTGTSGATEPVWPLVIGETVTDNAGANQIVWVCEKGAPWIPTYDLRAAACEGWSWKAGKVASDFDVKAGSITAFRNQVAKTCMENAKKYCRGSLTSVETTTRDATYRY